MCLWNDWVIETSALEHRYPATGVAAYDRDRLLHQMTPRLPIARPSSPPRSAGPPPDCRGNHPSPSAHVNYLRRPQAATAGLQRVILVNGLHRPACLAGASDGIRSQPSATTLPHESRRPLDCLRTHRGRLTSLFSSSIIAHSRAHRPSACWPETKDPLTRGRRRDTRQCESKDASRRTGAARTRRAVLQPGTGSTLPIPFGVRRTTDASKLSRMAPSALRYTDVVGAPTNSVLESTPRCRSAQRPTWSSHRASRRYDLAIRRRLSPIQRRCPDSEMRCGSGGRGSARQAARV